MKNVLDFSESSIKICCISDSILKLKGCINETLNQICHEEVSQIQKTGLEWGIYARHSREASLNGLAYWLTGISVFY